MTEEKYLCLVCGKKKDTLISVISNLDKGSFFYHNRGVCQNCLRDRNIDKVCKEAVMLKAEEQLKSAEQHLEFIQNEIKGMREEADTK
jgi:hypothetical protein